jgi:Uma2 family endonuclease
MGTTTQKMTVAELERLPESGLLFYELRDGELVQMTRPALKHQVIQVRIINLLRSSAGQRSFVSMEFPFRALPEHEFRIADVAFVSQERWEHVDLESHFQGAPDLVVEVLSPSNTAQEMLEKQKLCLDNGAREFWVVNPKLRQVSVATPGGITTTYSEGQEIPLPLFGGGSLKVEAIFS